MLPVNINTLLRAPLFVLNRLLYHIQGTVPDPKYYPQILYLEICRSCNLNCPMCLRHLLPKEERSGIMPIEDVKKVIKNAGAHIIGVGLGGWGEPMLHPDFLEILKLLESKGVLISFDTNGLLLKEYANDLVNIKTLYHIGISFDFLPGSFKDAHSLTDALEGLQALVEAKKRKGKKYPLVRVTVTLMKSNVHMLPELVKLVSEYGGTWLDCHEATVFDANKLNSPFAPPSKEEVKYYFNKAKEIGAKLGVKVTYGRHYTEPITHAKSTSTCSAPWISVFVDFKGYVHPCCYYLHLSLGNLREAKLKQVYKSNNYRNFRVNLLAGNDQFCKNCLSGTMYKNWEGIKDVFSS